MSTEKAPQPRGKKKTVKPGAQSQPIDIARIRAALPKISARQAQRAQILDEKISRAAREKVLEALLVNQLHEVLLRQLDYGVPIERVTETLIEDSRDCGIELDAGKLRRAIQAARNRAHRGAEQANNDSTGGLV